MSEDNTPVPQTTHKAWVGALVTVASYVAARFGIGEAPALESVTQALTELGGIAVSFLVGWLVVWITPNKDKTS